MQTADPTAAQEPEPPRSELPPAFTLPSVWSRSSAGVTSSMVGVALLLCVIGGVVLFAYLRLRPAPQSSGAAGGGASQRPLLIRGTHSFDGADGPRRQGVVAAPAGEAPRRSPRTRTPSNKQRSSTGTGVAVVGRAQRFPRAAGIRGGTQGDEAADALEAEAAREVREAVAAADALEARAIQEREAAEAAADELEARAEQARAAAEDAHEAGRLSDDALENARLAEAQARVQAEELRERAQEAEAQTRARAEQLRDHAREVEAQALRRANRLREDEEADR
ncbi:MAG TPA: hypothetical protein VK689_11450 [Armatimonadota bacterium]|nr:hypothetical protein [Armatimonadota bacterium]